MIDKESKRLNREELLEILIEQAKEITALQSKILRLEEELENKKNRIAKSDSMAEAVLKLNGIYTDAEKTAEQYVENARLKEEESKRILEETRQKADRMIAEAEKIRDAKTQQPNGICKR